MFITKKHLSRRTVLRGRRRRHRAAAAGRDDPRGHGAGADGRGAEAAPGLRLLPARRGAWQRWTPKATGTAFELPLILKPLEPYKQHMTVVSGLRNKAARARARTASSRAPGSAASRRRSSHDAGRRRHGRPDRRAAHRAGHAAAVARARRRGRRRRCEPAVRLQLRRHDRVPHADAAAADGVQPAQGVLSAVRPGRHGGGARGDRCERPAACSTTCARARRA